MPRTKKSKEVQEAQKRAKAAILQITNQIKTTGPGDKKDMLQAADARNIINKYLTTDDKIPDLRVPKGKDKGLSGRGEIKSHLLKLVKEGTLKGPDIDKLTTNLKQQFGVNQSQIGMVDITGITMALTGDDMVVDDGSQVQLQIGDGESSIASGSKGSGSQNSKGSQILRGLEEESKSATGSKKSAAKSQKSPGDAEMYEKFKEEQAKGGLKLELMNYALKKDTADKSNLFPISQGLKGQNVSEEVKLQGFEADIGNIQQVAHSHQDPKKVAGVKRLIATFLKYHTAPAFQDVKEAGINKQVDQLEKRNAELLRIGSSKTNPVTEEQSAGMKAEYEKNDTMIQYLRDRMIKQYNTIQPVQVVGSSGVQNQEPGIGRISERSDINAPAKPRSVEEATTQIKQTLQQSGRSKSQQKQILRRAMDISKSNQSQKAGQQSIQPLQGIGGDAQNATGEQSRVNQRVVTGQYSMGINDVYDSLAGDQQFYDALSQQYGQNDAQRQLTAQVIEPGPDFPGNYEYVMNQSQEESEYQQSSNRSQKSSSGSSSSATVLNRQISDAIISNLRSQNLSQPVPNNPRQIVLVNIPKLPSMEQQPIVRKTPAQQKRELARAEFDKKNPKPVQDANARKKLEKAARRGDAQASYTITLQDYIDYMFKAADYISKIEGDIVPGQSLSEYKTQTSIFTPKIQKLETNEFKITPNSAFKVRACC